MGVRRRHIVIVPSVLVDARLILPKPTGIGEYLTSLLPELLALAPDWTFHVLRRPNPWPDYGVREWSAPNLVFHETTERHMSLTQHWTVPALAKRLRVDVLHYPHFDAPVYFGRVPVVATIYHLQSSPKASGDLSAAKRAYAHFCTSATIRRAAAILTISRSTADEIARVFGALRPVRVTPLAAGPSFRPASEEAISGFRDEFGLRRPFALYVGEFRPHKNVAGLLAAWEKSAHRETHDLVLAGMIHSASESPEAEIRRRGLGEGVRILQGISRNRLVAAYSAARVFVLPSHFEGFGLPVLEAMGCGTPVITSRTTATAEVAGDAALLVDPAKIAEITAALDRILGSEAERAAWIEKGRRRHAEFTWRRTAELTLEAYRGIVAAGRK